MGSSGSSKAEESLAMPEGDKRPLRLQRRILLAFFGGVFVPMGFDPWGLIFLMPVGFLFLAMATDGLNWKQALLVGWAFGLGIEGASFPWLAQTVNTYVGIYVLGEPHSWKSWIAGIGVFMLWWPLSSLGWALCSLLLSMAPCSSGSRQRIWKCFGIMIFVALYEQYWPRIFPWSIGSSLATSEPSVGWMLLRQWGAEGVSLLIAASGFMAAHTILWVLSGWSEGRKIQTSSRLLLLVPALLLAFLPYFSLSSVSVESSAATKTRVFSVVQPAFRLEDRHGQNYLTQWQKLRELVQVASTDLGPDGLVILPEGILPGSHSQVSLRAWATDWLKVPLLTGMSYEVPESGRYANAVALLTPGIETRPRRSLTVRVGLKKDLVPFGERIPLEGWLKSMGIPLPIPTFVAGTEPVIFPLGGDSMPQTLGVSICYEGILESTASGLIDGGSQIHVNVTEDLWYGDYIEPNQHLQLQRSRSIESGLPLVRCTNAGYSVIFDPQMMNAPTLESTRRWFPETGWSPWSRYDGKGEVRLTETIGQQGILQARLGDGGELLQGPLLKIPLGGAPLLTLIWVIQAWIQRKKP